jgi:multidrug efflux pump subunit AcrA (membrane-fusion protein)
MYKSNDLTEETEQIILKRQRFWVEEATNRLRTAEIERDHALKTTLPRKEIAAREAVRKQGLALDKARDTLMPMVSQKQKSLLKMRFDRDKLAAALETLQKDRAGMTITAPADGVVYYGSFAPGNWENAAAAAGKLVPDGHVMPDEVFMTIVRSGPLFFRAQVEEKDLHLLKNGLAGKAKMVFDPEVKLKARVKSVASVPASPGKFEALVDLDAGNRNDLMPGMASTAHFVPYSKKQALLVATAALYEDDDQSFLDVQKDGKREKRRVTTGRSHNGHTEIIDGVQEGEEFFMQRAETKPANPTTGGE